MCLYNLADFGLRNGAIIPLTSNARDIGLISITRGSIKNSFKYLRTSFVSGLSGVPKLTSKIPFLIIFISAGNFCFFLVREVGKASKSGRNDGMMKCNSVQKRVLVFRTISLEPFQCCLNILHQ